MNTTTHMIWKASVFAMLAVAVSVAAGCAEAQQRTHGSAGVAFKDPIVGDGGLLSVPAGSATLRWSPLGGAGFTGPVDTALPFSVVGGITMTGGRTLVASGIDSNDHGVLVRLVLTNPHTTDPEAVIEEVMPLGSGIDPQSVFWHAGESSLYILDAITSRVIRAPYGGHGMTLPALSSYEQAAALSAPICDITRLVNPLGASPRASRSTTPTSHHSTCMFSPTPAAGRCSRRPGPNEGLHTSRPGTSRTRVSFRPSDRYGFSAVLRSMTWSRS